MERARGENTYQMTVFDVGGLSMVFFGLCWWLLGGCGRPSTFAWTLSVLSFWSGLSMAVATGTCAKVRPECGEGARGRRERRRRLKARWRRLVKASMVRPTGIELSGMNCVKFRIGFLEEKLDSFSSPALRQRVVHEQMHHRTELIVHSLFFSKCCALVFEAKASYVCGMVFSCVTRARASGASNHAPDLHLQSASCEYASLFRQIT